MDGIGSSVNDSTQATTCWKRLVPSDISIATISAGSTYVRAYADPGSLAVYKPGVSGATAPLLSYVRFGIKIGTAAMSAHVKIHVVQRDM